MCFDKRGKRILGGIAAGMLSLCLGHADTNRLILQEDFESFKTTRAMRSTWPGGPGELMTNAPGGGQAASHDGTGVNRRGGFFVFPDATHNLVLQADFYDFATNTDQNLIVSLNGEDTHDNVAFGLKGSYCYVARVGGFSSKTNWIPFKRGQSPVFGWHRFKAVITVSNLIVTLDLGADGQVDRTLQIPFNKPAPTFTQLRFGGYSKVAGPGIALVDNIKLELVSLETTAIAANGTNGSAVTTVPPYPSSQENGLLSPTLPSKGGEGETSAAAAVIGRETNVSLSASAAEAVVAAPERSALTNAQKLSVVPAGSPGLVSHPERAVSSPAGQASGTLPAAVWWICAALAVIIGLLGAVILMLRRQAVATPRALLVESTDGEIESGDKMLASSRGDRHWRERALQAEAVAAKQAQILGEKVGPELVEFAKDTLVQGLYTQRNALLETQVKAKQTLMELETRLSELHLPAQERIRAYEKRIAELEKQLESRGDEMRELTRATLLLVQERLEQEREQQGPRFN